MDTYGQQCNRLCCSRSRCIPIVLVILLMESLVLPSLFRVENKPVQNTYEEVSGKVKAKTRQHQFIHASLPSEGIKYSHITYMIKSVLLLEC